MKKITVIGGGTGTFVVLSGLKFYPLDLGVIVTMMDSGGSTGKLRDQLGVLPPGDLRQCLVALSEASSLWRNLFLYRFESGDLKGHNFGNIFISALEKVCENYNEVIEAASYILRCKGEVIPATLKKTNLIAEYSDGSLLRGEGRIDGNQSIDKKIKRIYLDPPVEANFSAVRRIENSDYLILGPGDLYTSIIPVLLFGEIRTALLESRAKIIYIVNLMTKAGQTHKFTAVDHVNLVQKYLGREVDKILINNQPIAQEILDFYKKSQEYPVEDNLGSDGRVIRADILSSKQVEKSRSDTVKRSVLRHSPEKLARVIFKLIQS